MTVLTPTILCNFDNAVELEEKTGFSLANTLTVAWYECRYTHFILNDVPFEINLPTLMSDHDCNAGGFSIFVQADEQQVAELYKHTDNFVKDINEPIINNIRKFVNELNDKVNVVVPADNFDNIIYNENDEQFYIKFGEPSSALIKLAFELDQDDIEQCWNRDLRAYNNT